MKKRIGFICFITCGLMLAGCSSNSSDVAQTTEIAAEALEGYKLEKADDGVITLNISKDCEKPYKKEDIDSLLGIYLDWKYDKEVVNSDSLYCHIKEVQNGNDTGTYAVFVMRADGTIEAASFYQGSAYDIDETKLIGEEKAYEKACQYIHEKYDTSDETYELDTKISDAKIRWTEIKGTLLYTMEIVGYRKGAEHSEINEVVFYPQIDAYDGTCIEIASTLMR